MGLGLTLELDQEVTRTCRPARPAQSLAAALLAPGTAGGLPTRRAALLHGGPNRGTRPVRAECEEMFAHD